MMLRNNLFLEGDNNIQLPKKNEKVQLTFWLHSAQAEDLSRRPWRVATS